MVVPPNLRRPLGASKKNRGATGNLARGRTYLQGRSRAFAYGPSASLTLSENLPSAPSDRCWCVRPYRPGTTRRAANQHEERAWIPRRFRLLCCYDASPLVQHENRSQLQVRCCLSQVGRPFSPHSLSPAPGRPQDGSDRDHKWHATCPLQCGDGHGESSASARL